MVILPLLRPPDRRCRRDRDTGLDAPVHRPAVLRRAAESALAKVRLRAAELIREPKKLVALQDEIASTVVRLRR